MKLEDIVCEITSVKTKPNIIMRKYILPFFKENNVKTILDYGCGKFLRDSLFLTEQGFIVDAVDTEKQIKRIDKNKSRLINSLSTEIISDNYDAALLNFILQVIPSEEERKSVLDKVYQSIKDQGHLIISLRSMSDINYYAKPSGIPFKDGYLMKVGNNYTFVRGYDKESIEVLLSPFNPNVVAIYQSSCSYVLLGQKVK